MQNPSDSCHQKHICARGSAKRDDDSRSERGGREDRGQGGLTWTNQRTKSPAWKALLGITAVYRFPPVTHTKADSWSRLSL